MLPVVVVSNTKPGFAFRHQQALNELYSQLDVHQMTAQDIQSQLISKDQQLAEVRYTTALHTLLQRCASAHTHTHTHTLTLTLFEVQLLSMLLLHCRALQASKTVCCQHTVQEVQPVRP